MYEAHGMQLTHHYSCALLLTAAPLQVCTVEPFDVLWFMVFPYLTFIFSDPGQCSQCLDSLLLTETRNGLFTLS
jgi:hypothetical protein